MIEVGAKTGGRCGQEYVSDRAWFLNTGYIGEFPNFFFLISDAEA